MRGFGPKKVNNSSVFLADRARDARDWASATRYYRQALEEKSDNPAIWVQYGHALKESGHVSEAERAYRRALELAPDIADTHLQLGHALKIQGRRDEAAAAYLRALALDAKLHHASSELRSLGWPTFALNDAIKVGVYRRLRPITALGDDEETEPAGLSHTLVFDVSDLMNYFLAFRAPSGIQRVQISVITSLLSKEARDYSLTIACCTLRTDHWIKVPVQLFRELADLAIAGSRLDDPDWRVLVSELQLLLNVGKPLEFKPNSVLVNIGSSWRLPDYFLMVRTAKAKYGIRYIPFVHDCIPLLVPEYCQPETVQEYRNWIIGVFFHADAFLTNSRSTAADLTKFARLLGHDIEDPHVVRLDGCFAADPKDRNLGNESRGFLASHALDEEDFVLLVSTIEGRKNHLMAFDAWLALITKRGLRKTPLLVCVGKFDPTAEAAMARLNSSEALKRKILIVAQIPDRDLAALYQRCLFTLYPSHYEGWGLPVTESLSYGKVPLTTTVSALAEAGGDLAEYFDLLSLRDLVGKLERLIDDKEYRAAREARIRAGFRSRSWGDIGAEIVASVLPQRDIQSVTVASIPVEVLETHPMPAETGRYYGIARNNETGIARGMVAGEMYRLGDGWWAAEDWGTWMKEDSADLAFSLRDDGDCNHLVYLGLRAPPQESDFRVRVAGSDGEESGTLDPGEDRWLAFEIGPNPVGSFAVHLRITSSARCDLASKEEMRTVGLGALGFYVCRADDLAARQRFLEAVQFKRLDRLTRRPPKPEERSRSGVIELARDAAEGNGSADCANLKRRADARKHG